MNSDTPPGADGTKPPLAPGGEHDAPWTILRVLTWTAERLARAGVATPRLDAEVLLAHVLAVERIRLYVEHDKPLRPEELERYRGLVRRRLAREPAAYIVGRREFWSVELAVSSAVLVPRPETELLVEVVLELLRGRPSPIVVDVGTGSGAVAIALRRELAGGRVLATESDLAALAVARENAACHAPTLELLDGDLLAPLPVELCPDVVAANLPYIPSADIAALAPEVRDHEPRVALDGGPDGLELVRRLVVQAAERLAPAGALALEIGVGQGAVVSALLAAAGFVDVAVRRDLAGLERVVVGRRPPA